MKSRLNKRLKKVRVQKVRLEWITINLDKLVKSVEIDGIIDKEETIALCKMMRKIDASFKDFSSHQKTTKTKRAQDLIKDLGRENSED